MMVTFFNEDGTKSFSLRPTFGSNEIWITNEIFKESLLNADVVSNQIYEAIKKCFEGK